LDDSFLFNTSVVFNCPFISVEIDPISFIGFDSCDPDPFSDPFESAAGSAGKADFFGRSGPLLGGDAKQSP